MSTSDDKPMRQDSGPWIVRLGNDAEPPGFDQLRQVFERRNPGYGLAWQPTLASLGSAATTRVVFVQRGKAEASVHGPAGGRSSAVDVGDIAIVRPGETFTSRPSVAALVFFVPQDAPADVPSFIRPDWDPRITDQPGGCATERGAYRRILLTWLKKVGPYTYRALNAHRVRIMDSFSHYHPIDGGFDEFYLVQMALPAARLLTSHRIDLIERPATVSRVDARSLLQETRLEVGDLVYLPRGLLHRGVGGVLAQVITVPGFRPGAEIGVDHHLRAINERLGLTGADALPLNLAASTAPVVR